MGRQRHMVHRGIFPFSALDSGKNLSYPLDHLCQVLRFSSADEASSVLASLGIKTVDNCVIFVKSGTGNGARKLVNDDEIDQAPKYKRFGFLDQLILRFPHFPLKS